MDEKREAIINNGDEQELNDLRHFLFKESCRLENQESALSDQWAKLEKERHALHDEIEQERRELQQQRAELEHESSFFGEKLKILESGYAKLDIDRQEIARQRKEIERERRMLQEDIDYADSRMRENEAFHMEVFFKGADSSLAIKKRYRALMKVFHPDNAGGDDELVQLLNIEYSKLLQEYGNVMDEMS